MGPNVILQLTHRVCTYQIRVISTSFSLSFLFVDFEFPFWGSKEAREKNLNNLGFGK